MTATCASFTLPREVGSLCESAEHEKRIVWVAFSLLAQINICGDARCNSAPTFNKRHSPSTINLENFHSSKNSPCRIRKFGSPPLMSAETGILKPPPISLSASIVSHFSPKTFSFQKTNQFIKNFTFLSPYLHESNVFIFNIFTPIHSFHQSSSFPAYFHSMPPPQQVPMLS
mmetsp:Transcript_1736/g.6088  ORF Transcript_1736/g.6088 Transcript_1736/m.6088 type:complete len:172 (+) Transcript_1736:514-1029(+)